MVLNSDKTYGELIIMSDEGKERLLKMSECELNEFSLFITRSLNDSIQKIIE